MAAHAATLVPGGNVSGTWDAAGSPYLVMGDITVPVGFVLNIEDTGAGTVDVTIRSHTGEAQTVSGVEALSGGEPAGCTSLRTILASTARTSKSMSGGAIRPS